MVVMPRLSGASVESALAAWGPFSVPHALWIARQVAAGLAALHEAGWIHADVKPGNIHVTVEGHATLLDLGLALRLDSEECGFHHTLRGSPTYTSPEMISAATTLDAKCDIYSLGITLYEMLTGRPPFVETEPGPLMLAHLQRAVPNARKRIPTLHHKIGPLLLDMLAKEPLRRPTTRELLQRLVDLEIETLAERAA
jgi:serine/threonine-protein kinase